MWMLKNIGIKASNDFTGRDRFVSNVLYSWAGFFVLIVSRFFMPRLIDQKIGQTALGIWDLSWSIVAYLGIIMFGLSSSVNRYVAMYRSQQDIEALRRAASSVLCMQIGIGAVVMIAVILLTAFLPFMMKNLNETDLSTARCVLLFLGASLAIQCACDTSKGVITGCHRWDIYNLMMGISEAAAIGGMVSVLIAGGGLIGVAAIYMTIVLLTESARMVVAFSVCPELKIRKKYIYFGDAKEMFLFGAKTFVNGIAQMVIVNSTCIFIGGILGPNSLAIFSRPMAIIRNFQTFIDKFAFVITPTTGSLIGMGKIEDLRQLLISMCRYGNAIAFPCAAFLIGYADIILEFWMGPRYAEGTILQIMTLFYILPIGQTPALRILIGMDRHGKAGLIAGIIALIVFGILMLMMGLENLSLTKSALLISIPIMISNGIVIPFFACYQLGVNKTHYLRDAFLAPTACTIPIAFWIMFSRSVFEDSALMSFSVGCIGGGLIIVVLYFRYMIPQAFKKNIIQMFT